MKNTFVMLTRLVSEEVHPSLTVEQKSRAVEESVREHCPRVKWVGNYAVLGPWDYVDIFQAPDTETAMKVAALVRFHGGAQTEIWPAVTWDGYKDILHEMPKEATGRESRT